MWFLSKKKFKSRVSFLSEEDVFVKIKLPLTRLWPRFLTQRIAANKKGDSVDADFCVVGFQQQVEKKAKKTRLWLGPPSWWKLTSKITSFLLIIALKSLGITQYYPVGKIFETVTKAQLDPFPALVPIENCSFHPLKMYLEYLDTDYVLSWQIFRKYLEGDKSERLFNWP